MPDHRARLAAIKRFDQLVVYLRDDMGWPIEGDDFEEITFDYTAEELGIDAANRAKIQEIKRLRPLAANQPWGIFFVKFEPKRLPVVALRRILSRVVLKKRAAANSADRAAWDLADLLFISNYGDDAERRISFAHFVQDDDWGDLPTLKVLGWDGDDTNLHLDHVARELTTKLRWPDDMADVPAWRSTWGDAFTLRHREVITTAKRLAERLADLARETRKKANAALAIESATGPLRTLMDAFKKALIHDLDDDGFADMYAQTIAYGLLSARISRTEGLTADNMADMVPVTNPFLKEMLESFLRLGGRRRSGQGWTGIDFDELGINEIVQVLREANMEAVLRDFGDRNPQEDPVIHFYEHFLKEYDAKKRMQRGVFYTPRPVVSYIVRSVHELLQTEFGLADGLADTATWGDMLERHPGLKLPPLTDSPGEKQNISPDESFVQILDPATGTATFLVEVIEVIHATLKVKWKQQRLTEAQQVAAWNDYVPRHLLPRLHGFELMMAPYAIAHMKIGLKLAETGYKFGSEERARIYLTNTLEPWVKQLPLIGFEALAHEAAAVNEIKRSKRFTVVIGNPPYAGVSANMSEATSALIEPYKFIDGNPLGERKHWLQDDYVKFIRLAQLVVERAGVGVLGYITNHGYLDNPTFRGMRQNLIHSFSDIRVLDLQGSVKKRDAETLARRDENVFDIEQGVAIGVFLRPLKPHASTIVHHASLLGPRAEKYEWLTRRASVTQTQLNPSSPYYFFVKREENHREEYEALISVTSVFQIWSTGVQTSRDSFAVAPTRQELEKRLEEFLSATVSDHRLKDAYGLKDMSFWRIAEVRRDFRRVAHPSSYIRPIDYRPFDTQYVIFHEMIIHRPKAKVMRHMLAGGNLALLLPRQLAGEDFHHALCSRSLAEMCVISTKTTEQNNLFPLYLYEEEGGLSFSTTEVKKRCLTRSPNFTPQFLRTIAKALGVQPAGPHDLPAELTPEDIFHYAYAVFHSPGYRSRYAEFLKIDFPRLPLTGSLELFRALVQLGGDLVALHLLESPTLDHPITEFIGSRNPEVEKPSWSQDTVWVDKRQTIGFKGVPEAVWNFHIGGYQVCQKWLKDRKGRTLSDDDIAHYQKIVVALNETIRLMQEIDEVIDQHGGWPGAFAVNTGGQA